MGLERFASFLRNPILRFEFDSMNIVEILFYNERLFKYTIIYILLVTFKKSKCN